MHCNLTNDYFTAANKFQPEHWVDQRHLGQEARILVPFGLVAYECPMKQLALMELKVVLASILRELCISIPNGTRAEDLEPHVEAG
jgi:cytochrome P450